MNKRRPIFDFPGNLRGKLLSFAVLAGSFLVGVLLGTALAGSFVKEGKAADYLAGFSASLEAGGHTLDTVYVFFKLSAFHIIAFLLGFSMLGVVLVPALSLIRGFTLAFTLAVLTRACDAGGVLTGYILLGAPAIISVPLFFLIATDALRGGVGLVRVLLTRDINGLDTFSGPLFIRFFAVLILLLLLSAGESAVINLGVLELPIF